MADQKDDGILHERPREQLVQNVIAQCENRNGHQLIGSKLAYIIVHRTDLSRLAPGNPNPVSDLMLDGPGLALRFRDLGLGTGGLTPYHFLILVDGSVQQLLPLSLQGAHSVDYNWRSIAIAVVGTDLEHRAPLHSQITSLVRLIALLKGLNGGLRVAGHTDLPGASHDPNKICPGPFLPADDLSRAADAFLPGGLAGSPAHIDFVMGQAGITT